MDQVLLADDGLKARLAIAAVLLLAVVIGMAARWLWRARRNQLNISKGTRR